MTPEQHADRMIARCDAGFDNEHHWRTWKRVNKKSIEALPVPLRKAVLAAHANATHKDFSGAPKEGS